MTKRIQLFKGRNRSDLYVKIDNEDFPVLNNYRWYLNAEGYAIRYEYQQGRRRNVLMHRFILDLPSELLGDHINGNRLDNRRKNLRAVNRAQNSMNSAVRRHSKTQIKGVTKKGNVWQASIRYDGRRVYIGTFSTGIAAAQAYNIAANRFHGQFARLNNIDALKANPAFSIVVARHRALKQSGVPGVTWDETRGRWRVSVGSGRSTRFIGRFAKLDLAIEARNQFTP